MKMTTVKLKPSTKDKLKKIKTGRETYGDVVERLAKKELLEEELSEEYRRTAEEDRKIAKEWEGTLADGLDDEW